MRLSEWQRATLPQAMLSYPCAEQRRVLRLLGGRVVEAETVAVKFREVWRVGECRHVVLELQTRRRIPMPCPDCTPPEEAR